MTGILVTTSERFWSKFDLSDPYGCWRWCASVNKDGYGWFRVGSKMRRAHVVALELSSGELSKGRCALHSCDNPPCCNPTHLRWGTMADNVRDRDARGRRMAPRGVANGRSKLNDTKVRRLRLLYGSGRYTLEQLAELVGVCISTVGNVVRGSSWT